MATACLFVFMHAHSNAGEGEPAIQVSLDPYVSFETGSDLTGTSVSMISRLEERAFRPLRDRPTLGPPVRLARTLLFDAPVAWWFGVVEHEAFGHGGRAREFGSRAGVHLGSPWGGRDSYATFSTRGLSNDDLLRVYTGGSEANGRTATLLERDLVAGGSSHPLELLFIPANRFVASDYVLRTTPDPVRDPGGFFDEWTGGGDVAHYLGYLNTRFHGQPGITPTGSSADVASQWRRLRRQAYWNALDPGAWLALWAAERHVATARDPLAVPLPRVAGRRFLPVLSSDWLPDGGASSLEVVLGAREKAAVDGGPRWFSFVLRRGRGPAGGFGALGAASERLWETEHLRVGGEVEVWSSPRRSPGGGGQLRFHAARGPLAGLMLEVGVKSDGHWPGRPAGVGPFVRLGSRIRLGRPTQARLSRRRGTGG